MWNQSNNFYNRLQIGRFAGYQNAVLFSIILMWLDDQVV